MQPAARSRLALTRDGRSAPDVALEGEVYIRPVGRVELCGQDPPLDLDQAVADFYEQATGRWVAGNRARLRIGIELIDAPSSPSRIP